MSEDILRISSEFWNIRGDFKVFGMLNIGTHCSLVRRANDRYVFLDAYTLTDEIKEMVDERTDGGAKIDAILNLHPFHTIHVERAHQQYPDAKLYGTSRHIEKFPDLPWETERTESAGFAKLFADDFEFSVPQGVDFIPDNEHLHFASVLAYHRDSQTIHSDDTLMYLELPAPLGWLKSPDISFHPTLAKTLEKRAAAAQEFRTWAFGLIENWGDAENLCAAHSAAWLSNEHPETTLKTKLVAALDKVEHTLKEHEVKYG